MSPRHSRLEAFASLNWYEAFLRFVANFIAKSSELLLAIGLIVSSANFLTDGDILGVGSPASKAWAWTQAIAIDSSLGVSFYYVLHCLKQRDWVKFALYSSLTLILTLVAGIITDGDIFSHAIHKPIHDSMALLGIDVQALSILRSVAVVGFVLMSRLRDVSFKDLVVPSEAPREGLQVGVFQQGERNTPGETPQLTLEEVALLLQALTRSTAEASARLVPQHLEHKTVSIVSQSDQSSLVAEQETHLERSSLAQGQANSGMPVPAPREPVPPDHPLKEQVLPREPIIRPVAETASVSPAHDSMLMERDERLEHAYQELLAEGQKISGRTLAQHAHVHRATCVEWLRVRQQRISASQSPPFGSEQEVREAEDPSLSEQKEDEQTNSPDLPDS